MIDIKFLRENPDIVKQNIKNKFQDHKLGLVDEVIELDASSRTVQQEADDLRANRNRISKQIGALMGQGKKEEAMALKEQVAKDAERLTELEAQEGELQEKIKKIMMTIPNIIDPSVPIGKDDSENVEVERFGEPVVPDFEIPYHTEIMEKFDGIDLDSARKEQLPKTLTSYSPCFRKEKGAHGIEERGVYRIHQFEKQEMIVVCKPEDSMMWYEKLWQNTVDLFRSLDIPVRTLECCSGDLADLKVKSVDVEAWSPRQKKYFEVGSCSNLGDAQARRLKIRVKGADGKKYLAHTLNNTVVAPPRMLIAFLENNLNADGTVNIPKALQPYMGGKTKIE